MTTIADMGVNLGDSLFMEPYLNRAFANELDADAPGSAMVLISTTDVYSPTDGNLLDESTPVDEKSEAYSREAQFLAEARDANMPALILRCANIVGTGMTGLPRRLANGIYRGNYMHISNNDAKISTVHAIDVARIVHALYGTNGIYNITDGCEHSIHDFCEALSHRMKDKRIAVIKPRWAKWYYSSQFYNKLTHTLTFSNAAVTQLLDFPLINVTDYLRNHEYSENDI